jgi:hypothetical protein
MPYTSFLLDKYVNNDYKGNHFSVIIAIFAEKIARTVCTSAVLNNALRDVLLGMIPLSVRGNTSSRTSSIAYQMLCKTKDYPST